MHINDKMIPQYIHHIWIQGSPPPKHQREVEARRELNPDWTVKVWSGEEIRFLIKQHVPELLSLWDYPENLKNFNGRYYVQSNIGRIVIVYLYGGWYMDIDAVCPLPLSALNIPADTDLVLTHMTSHTVFAAAPFHPGMRRALEMKVGAKTRRDVSTAFLRVFRTNTYPSHTLTYPTFKEKLPLPYTPWTVCGIPFDTSWGQQEVYYAYIGIALVATAAVVLVSIGCMKYARRRK